MPTVRLHPLKLVLHRDSDRSRVPPLLHMRLHRRQRQALDAPRAEAVKQLGERLKRVLAKAPLWHVGDAH